MLSYSLAPTIQTIYCHIPKHLHLPTMLQAVIFPDTGTYHPDYNSVIFSNTGIYHPDYVVSRS